MGLLTVTHGTYTKEVIYTIDTTTAFAATVTRSGNTGTATSVGVQGVSLYQIILITGTTNYDGEYMVSNVVDDYSFEFTFPYPPSASGAQAGTVTFKDTSAASSVSDLATAVGNAVIALGWTLYDANAGTNAKAYRALNVDGITYKYIVLDFNTDNTMFCQVYESWNSGTHVGTNLCYESDTVGQRVDLTSVGAIWINGCTKWLVFLGALGNAGVGNGDTFGGVDGYENLPCGVYEISRDNALDTGAGGVPCFAFSTLGYYTNNWSPFMTPRDSAGNTGADAGYEPYSTAWTYVASASVMAWDTNPTVYPIFCYKDYYGTNFGEWKGRVYGLKRAYGSTLLEVNALPVDADLFLSSTGTNVPHINLGYDGGAQLAIFPR